MSDRVSIEVVSGVEGPSIYINGLRVAGNKPWGGGRVTHQFSAALWEIREAMGLPVSTAGDESCLTCGRTSMTSCDLGPFYDEGRGCTGWIPKEETL